MAATINKNGTSVWGIPVTQDFSKVLVEMSAKEGKTPHDCLLYLAYLGAECRRMHGAKNDRR